MINFLFSSVVWTLIPYVSTGKESDVEAEVTDLLIEVSGQSLPVFKHNLDYAQVTG